MPAEDLLGARLEVGVDREAAGRCRSRRSASVLRSSSLPSASRTISRSPSVPCSSLLLGGLEAGQAVVVDAHRADHLRRQLALRVDALAVGRGRRCPPGPACGSARRWAGRPCGRRTRSPSRGSASSARISSGSRVEHLGAASSAASADPRPGTASRRSSRRPRRPPARCRCGRGSSRASPGTTTVSVCWLCASALSSRAPHALQPGGPGDDQRRARSGESANRRPMRRSTRPIASSPTAPAPSSR